MFDVSPALDRLERLTESVVGILPNLVLALVVLVIFVVLAKVTRLIVHRITERRVKMQSAGLAVGRLAQAGVILLGILSAFAVALPNFHPADVVRVLGIGSVAIGFAFRDILQNFLAGILLLVTQPFRIGDQIVKGEFEGTVEDIQTRATFIRTYDGRRVVIPNADLFTDSVVVNTALENRRVEYDVGIGYGDDIPQVKQLILDALKEMEEVLEDPAPDVLVWELADFSVMIRVRWWVHPPLRADFLDARDKVLEAIKARLQKNGIDLPFPTTQVLFHDQTEEFDGDRRRQREGWPARNRESPRPRSIAQALQSATRNQQTSLP